MGPDQTVEIMRRVLMEAMVLSAPLLIATCLVSLAVSLLQTLTSVQEQTMSLIPKMLAVMLVVLLLLAPGLQIMREYTERIFSELVSFGTS